MAILRYTTPETIVAGITTRENGFSKGKFKGYNVGLNTNDNKEDVDQNRNHFFSNFSSQFSAYFLEQVHSSSILNADDPSFSNNEKGDGLYTESNNKLLCVSAADCGNVLFYSSSHPIVMAIHVGWRGAKKGILREACRILAKYADISSFTAMVGPSIHCNDYEVGGEFYEYFSSEFLSVNYASVYFDLPAFIFSELRKNGIARIIDYNLNTYADPDKFYSYRRDGDTGRMLAFIGRR